jgi:hypothetical protein
MEKRMIRRIHGLGKLKTSKKGSIEMSFQFIFSVILVAVVIFVGFYVIKMFLDRAEQLKFLDFTSRLKSDQGIWGVWTQEEASQIFSGQINSKIKYVCFANINNCQDPNIAELKGFCRNISQKYQGKSYNMFFYPFGVAEKYHAASAVSVYCNADNEPIKKCIEIPKTPVCIKAKTAEGQWKIKMRLTKQNETSLVVISAA